MQEEDLNLQKEVQCEAQQIARRNCDYIRCRDTFKSTGSFRCKLLEGWLNEIAKPTIEAQMKEIMAAVQCKFFDFLFCVRLCSLMRPAYFVSCFACLTRARKVLCIAFICAQSGDVNIHVGPVSVRYECVMRCGSHWIPLNVPFPRMLQVFT